MDRTDIAGAAASAFEQLIVFAIIPLIWWLLTARKKEKFFIWIGLKKPAVNWRVMGICLAFFVGLYLIAQFLISPELMPEGLTSQGQYAGMGFAAVLPVLFFSMIQTGLAEEILFRGFLGKRLIAHMGFHAGNLIQALIFGALHGMLFGIVLNNMAVLGMLEIDEGGVMTIALLLTAFSGAGGWLLGYLTEKVAGGSIIPAWLVHGTGNFLASMAYAFDLL